jgi:predicted transcriptional regulator
MKNLFYLLLTIVSLSIGNLGFSQSASIKAITAINLTDPNDNPKDVPWVGEKVLMLLYTDPDVKDVNDNLSNAVKAKNFPSDQYSGIGIANCKETWIPNAGIRMKSRQKEKQFPGSVILLDKDRILQKTLDLGDCNEAGVIIIIGKDKLIKYTKYVKTPEESKAIIPTVIQIITTELAK